MPLTLGFLILLLLSGPPLRAQRYWEVGGGFGALHYKGDISPALHPGFARPGGHLFARYHLSRAVSLRGQAMGGAIFADDQKINDPFHRARGYSFRTRIVELSGNVEYNFLDFDYTKRGRHNWTPYVFAGLAVFNFQPNAEPTGSYRQTSVAVPFGLGAKWQVKGPWNVGLEFGTRRTWTDYLDKLGGEGLGPGQLQQADPTRRDMYYYTSLTLSYTFLRIICPD
jgi:hypothetical protein